MEKMFLVYEHLIVSNTISCFLWVFFLRCIAKMLPLSFVNGAILLQMSLEINQSSTNYSGG
jgi:hypothetical protein